MVVQVLSIGYRGLSPDKSRYRTCGFADRHLSEYRVNQALSRKSAVLIALVVSHSRCV